MIRNRYQFWPHKSVDNRISEAQPFNDPKYVFFNSYAKQVPETVFLISFPQYCAVITFMLVSEQFGVNQ
jgi:hypothetical protein